MIRNRFSPALVTVALAATAAGIALGAVAYAQRSPEHRGHAPAASAWPAHLVLTGLALGWLLLAAARGRRRGVGLPALLTAPLRRRAAARLRLAAHGPRVIAAAPLVLLMAYDLTRAGAQVIGGLDPNFTADAWGGPSYAGAMYCHYLDLGLLTALAATLLSRLVLPAPTFTTTLVGGHLDEHRSRA